jgi:hypothetical protein
MTTVSDNFNRTESSNLGSNWTEVVGDLRIVSNKLISVNGNQHSYARWTSDLAGHNHSVSLLCGGASNPTGNTIYVECCARANATNQACYVGRMTRTTGGVTTAEIGYRNAAGSFNSLATTSSTFVSSDSLTLDVLSDKLTLKKNGTVILGPITDTVITTGLRVGVAKICGTSSTTDYSIDSWAAADIDTIVLDVVALTWTGVDLAVNAKTQFATTQAALTWTGVDLDINAGAVIDLDPAELTWTGSSISINNDLVLVVGALTWTGEDLTVNAKTQLALEPAALTWTGSDTESTRWRTYPGWTIPEISGGVATGPVFSPTECIAVDTNTLLPEDQWASVVLTSIPSAGAVVRASDPNGPATLYGAAAHSINGVLLFAYVNGVYQGELAFSDPVVPLGQRLYLDAIGATLTVSLFDGVTETVVIGPIPTALITGGGFAGISTYRSTLEVIPGVDDYAAGDFSIDQGDSIENITPALMTWTGEDLVANAMTELDLDAMALTWVGEDLTVSGDEYLPLDPMSLAWTGLELGTSPTGLIPVGCVVAEVVTPVGCLV